ncbi:class I SAM-dependent methyltransferase [uncultured Jannaschia sp.]|uniref:class I SAM-dependent methyltransferase n=1 Tax=uncultured Jannaschia sp. TaxID=293347 RepID=UPI002613BFA8|nr:class I SAM-dependent methyltransferase [uncultured Jannaschia sp.]
MTELAFCPLCGAGSAEPVITLDDMPVICNQLWPDADAARTAPRATIELVACRTCALVWNRRYDPQKMVYAPGYENALHFSPRFRSFAETLAAGLTARHELKGADIVEIGCGDGYMLDQMVRQGAASAIGFDPSMADQPSEFTRRDGVRIVAEYFHPEQLDRSFDMVMCRHVVEHLDDPATLLGNIRRAIGNRPVPIYIEVPNAEWLFDVVSPWDVIYEHITYWTRSTMETLLRRTGFEPIDVIPGYGRQFLMAEAHPAAPDPVFRSADTVAALEAVKDFHRASEDGIAAWRARLGGIDGPVVVWGSGSKGITFVNVMGAEAGAICAMIDVNDRKHGLVAPGAAIPVVPPEALTEIQPALVIVSNGLYAAEIEAQVAGLGLAPEFAVLAG